MTKLERVPGNPNPQSANSTAVMIVNQRDPLELRAAQLAVASHVAGNVPCDFPGDPEQEFVLIELLDVLGLYRRFG